MSLRPYSRAWPAALALVAGCTHADGEDAGRWSDASSADVASDPVGDGDGSPETDGDAYADVVLDGAAGGFEGAGPLTFVATTGEILLDRLCDIDGDGTEDNAIADLGLPASQLMVITLNANLQGALEDRRRVIVHSPWVEDRRGPQDPDAVLLPFVGEELDVPEDPTDDLSGEEPFYIDGGSLDGCGEPRFAFEHARLEGGALSASDGTIPVPLSSRPPVGRLARAWGTMAPGGTSLSLTACSAGTIRDLGDAASFRVTESLSMLEIFLAGGAALGFPEIPGLDPDLDIDGDGLERLEADPVSFELVSCVDGDSTVIEGRDCYLDPRMADGFSLTMTFDMVSALFAGREPGWEDDAVGTCESLPEESLFDAR